MMKSFMREGFLKLDGLDKLQNIFYDPQLKANSKKMADMPKTVKLRASSVVMND